MTYHIFIGYDPAEHEAFQVAEYSLKKYATVPVEIHKIEHMDLRQKGLFYRRWKVDADGQYYCVEDGKPFSTCFSHSRFLVPELWRNLDDPNKSELVLFMDCDWVFLEDIGKMFKEIEKTRMLRNNAHPVYCVQHDFKPTTDIKMHGVQQSKYNMKLWSAFVVYDMAHPDNEHLIPEIVNSESGRWLHQFGWLTDVHKIGVIPEGWNFIPNHSEKNTSDICGIHFTELGPWHKGGENVRYADIWNKHLNEYLYSNMKNVSFNLRSIINGNTD
jgi:hypothetical protein